MARKMFSPNAIYRGMPVSRLFRISSVEDYRVLLRESAQRLAEKPAYEAHLENYTRFHFRETLERIVSNAEKILFLSAGDGSKEYYFANRYPDKDIAIADICDDMLRVIQQHAANPNLGIFVTDNLSVHTLQEQFDVVVALGCEYFYDDSKFVSMLESIHSAVKPGGMLALASFCVDREMTRGDVRSRLQFLARKAVSYFPLLAVLTNRVVKRRLVKFAGFTRELSDFDALFWKSPFYLKRIEFEGGADQYGQPAVLFELLKLVHPDSV